MRDPERIPQILNEIEKIWKENPDYRLGQLFVIAARPKVPSPQIFYVEDDDLMKGLRQFAAKDFKSLQRKDLAYWEKYPDVSRVDLQEISLELVENFIDLIRKDNLDIIITPRSLMKLNGAPIEEKSWMAKQETRVEILREILDQLAKKNTITEVQKGYVPIGKF